VLVGSALAAFAATAGIGSATVAGVLPPSPWWLVVVPLAALAAGWVMWSDASVRVERRRREVRQAANDLVQLLAVGLTTDQSVEQAVQFALSVGSTDSFDLIRRHLGSSARRGVPLWEALHSFGDDAGIRELGELAVSIERQGVQGVSIGETVATLAASMRAAALDELEREADRANANLSGPTIGFVVTTVVFLAYPLAMRVSEAFGG
jgi:Flp pilus assembly protein TadB